MSNYLGATTLGMMTLSIKGLFVTLSISNLGKNTLAGRVFFAIITRLPLCILLIVLLSVGLLSVVMLNAVTT